MTKEKGTAPGQFYREGLSLIDAVQRFGNERDAEAWFIEQRWPNGVCCPVCGSLNVQSRETRKPAPFRCRDCRKDFSVKTGTLMHDSKLPLSKWAIALYLYSTNLKGVSSMKLHRDLGITQKAAWHMAHRIRECYDDAIKFSGTVEVDETYVGGKEKNKHSSKRLKAGRGTVGKTAVIGIKERETGQVAVKVIENADKPTLQEFVNDHTTDHAMIFTDEHAGYKGLLNHEAVKHSLGQYADGEVHTNGIEGYWSMMKRGIIGTYHHVSAPHLQRYANEFATRQNNRPLDTLDQMSELVQNAEGKRLQYKTLIGKDTK